MCAPHRHRPGAWGVLPSSSTWRHVVVPNFVARDCCPCACRPRARPARGLRRCGGALHFDEYVRPGHQRLRRRAYRLAVRVYPCAPHLVHGLEVSLDILHPDCVHMHMHITFSHAQHAHAHAYHMHMHMHMLITCTCTCTCHMHMPHAHAHAHSWHARARRGGVVTGLGGALVAVKSEDLSTPACASSASVFARTAAVCVATQFESSAAVCPERYTVPLCTTMDDIRGSVVPKRVMPARVAAPRASEALSREGARAASNIDRLMAARDVGFGRGFNFCRRVYRAVSIGPYYLGIRPPPIGYSTFNRL